MSAGAPAAEWRHRLKAPLPPMAASLQSLELKLMDSAALGHVPDYFDSLVALTSLTLSAGLKVSALSRAVSIGGFHHCMSSKVDFRSCGRGAT